MQFVTQLRSHTAYTTLLYYFYSIIIRGETVSYKTFYKLELPDTGAEQQLSSKKERRDEKVFRGLVRSCSAASGDSNGSSRIKHVVLWSDFGDSMVGGNVFYCRLNTPSEHL
jgi:hypothetical protein